MVRGLLNVPPMNSAAQLRKAVLTAAIAALAAATAGCGALGFGANGGSNGGAGGGGGDGVTVDPQAELPNVTVISGAPVEALVTDRATVDLPSVASRLSVAHGLVAVGTASGVFVADPVKTSTLNPLAVHAESGAPADTGAVRWISRRQNGGVLVAASNGLFHDSDGELLLSPLSQSLPAQPASLDALGESTGEELWLVPEDASSNARVLQVAGGELWTVRLQNVDGAPEAAVALAPGLGLIAINGSAYEVDLNAHTAKRVAAELGEVHGFDRASDGTAYLATDSGLVVRAPDGSVSRRTFAAEGAQAVPTRSVFAAADGSVLVTTADAVLQLSNGTALKIAARTDGTAQLAPVARDGNGDTWTVDDGALVRLATGTPVSFATDVKPFFSAHCTSCHGSTGPGPAIAFADYDTVKAKSALIVKRLEADGTTPMPPQSTEVLSPSDYAVVLRWVAGGMKP